MSTYRPAPASEVPTTSLTQWRAYRVKSKHPKVHNTVHLVGRVADDGDGRVSSAVKRWDATTQEGVTASGRVYRLIGQPGSSMDALYVWREWCKQHKITEIKDVSERYVAKAKQPRKRVLKARAAA